MKTQTITVMVRAVVALLLSCAADSLRAECPTIDFEGLAVGTIVTNQYSGVTFSVVPQSCSGSPTLYMRTYVPPNGTSSGTKCIKIDQGCPDFSSDYLRMVFTLPQHDVSFALGDWGGKYVIRYYTTVSGSSGLIGSFIVTNAPGAGDVGVHRPVRITSASGAIRRVEVQESVGLFEAIDDLTFNVDTTAPVAEITSPAQLDCVCYGVSITGSASDPDGPISSWTLDRKAIGASAWTLINKGTTGVTNGTLGSWTPASSATDGYYSLRLRVQNACGVETTWITDVYLNRALNDFAIRSPVGGALLGGTVCVDGTVWDHCSGAFTLERKPAVGGAWVAFDSVSPPWVINDGLGSWNTRAVVDGAYLLRVIGTDSCGNAATNQISVTVDNSAPVAMLSAPVACATRSGIIQVRGTANDAHLDRWLLQYTGGDAHGWVNIATGKVSVVNGLLAEWNTAGLAACSYTLRLLVTDQAQLDCNGALRNQSEYNTTLKLSPDPLDQDTDADGMPDVWELAYEFNPNDPRDAALDPDRDRQSNLEEYRAGTDPRNPLSVLRITDITREENDVEVTWTTVGAHHYVLQEGGNILSGLGSTASPVLSIPRDGPRTVTFVHTNAAALPERYYRVRLLP